MIITHATNNSAEIYVFQVQYFFTNQSYIYDKEKLCLIMFHLFSFKLGFCSKFTAVQQNHHQLQDAIDDDSCR